MAVHPLVSSKRARIISTSLSLVGLAIVILTGYWVGMVLVIGVPLAIRQYLMGRFYDALLSLIIFIGAFVSFQFDIQWKLLLPIILTLAAIFLLFREFFEKETREESELEEDINMEIEEISEENASQKK